MVAESRTATTPHNDERRAATEAPADMVCRYRLDTTLTFVNEAYCRYFALPRNDLIGRRFVEFIPKERRAWIMKHIKAVIGAGTKEITHEVVKPDGSIGYQHWISRTVVEPNGQVVEIHAVGRDVSQLFCVHQELERQRAQLTHLTRVAILGQLSGAFAHELRQPLTAILSNAQAAQRLMRDDPIDLAQVREILNDIVADDVRMGQVIARLGSLLKKRSLELQPVDMNVIVQDALDLVRIQLAQSRVSVQTSFSANLPIVRGDEVQLEQVVLNLLLNAVEAMLSNDPSDRQVSVSTEFQSDRGIRISVRDHGVGFDPSAAEWLFEPFATTKRDGLGLGLSICRSIVEAHGGSIEARCNPDRGATVVVTLPPDASPRSSGNSTA